MTAKIRRAMSLICQLVLFSNLFIIKSLSKWIFSIDSIPSFRISMFLIARRDLRSALAAFSLLSVSFASRCGRRGLVGVVGSCSMGGCCPLGGMVSWDGIDGMNSAGAGGRESKKDLTAV
jgi:hypothetical protein